MADRQKSHFGTDGYRDLELREDALKNSGKSGNSYLNAKRKEKQKEAMKLRKQNKDTRKER